MLWVSACSEEGARSSWVKEGPEGFMDSRKVSRCFLGTQSKTSHVPVNWTVQVGSAGPSQEHALLCWGQIDCCEHCLSIKKPLFAWHIWHFGHSICCHLFTVKHFFVFWRVFGGGRGDSLMSRGDNSSISGFLKFVS